MKNAKLDSPTDATYPEKNGKELTILCGSDFEFPDSNCSDPLRKYLSILKSSANISSPKVLCFSPAPYGSHAEIQSTQTCPFAHHTLPCPSIPIPQGADFIGLHVSQVDADVHLPLPDAFRTFQMNQTIRSMQRSGTPILLHAHTPGIIGYQILRESRKRRLRGKPIPMIATHSSRYEAFVQTRIVEILRALRHNHPFSLNEVFTHGGLLEKLFPGLSEMPEVRAAVERFVNEIQSVVRHWHDIPNAKNYVANRSWGRFLLWLVNSISRHAHHRLQGSLSVAQALEEVNKLMGLLAGVPLSDIRQRPSNSTSLLDDAIKDISAQAVRSYLASFYKDCDCIVNLEGTKGREDLSSLGLPQDRIVDFNLETDLLEQIAQTYSRIVGSSPIQITTKRKSIQEFQWGIPLDTQPTATPHLAMSDVHLGDGSGTERAKALFELKPHFDRLGIQGIEIAGDLIQRDVSPEQSARHRESFLSALRQLTNCVPQSDQAFPKLKVELDLNQCNTKRYTEIRRELFDFALKVGAQIEFDGAPLGNLPHPTARCVPIYIEYGNHDEGEILEEVIPGSIASPSMIRLDRNSGILFCHGHIWNLPEIPIALKKATSFDDLAESLTEQNLRSSLETAQVIYSMTSALWRACAKRIDVRSLWKNDLQPSLSQFVQWYRVRKEENDSSPSEYSRFLSGVISPVDNATIAAQCGIVARSFGEFCWAVCDGHSHRPSIEFVSETNPQTGNLSGTLLVNCGKFHGKNITVAMMRFPEAVIFEWDDKDQTFYVLFHHRLTEEQIRIITSPETAPTPKTPGNFLQDSTPTANARTILEVCSEGGGHNERQLALLPLYEKQGTIHVAASGERNLPWAHEHWPGQTIVYAPDGRVKSLSTLVSFYRKKHRIRLKANQISNTLSQYTHAITDFAPVLPEAIRISHKNKSSNTPPLYHVSHHAALHSNYRDTPRPIDLDRIIFWATQKYINSIYGDFNIGFHFEKYHPDILTPPLSPEILGSVPSFNSNIILVYLQGSPTYIAEQCGSIDPQGEHEWHIYSTQQREIKRSRFNHIWLFPQSKTYREKLPHARAVITLSGFMGPAELLQLGKPFVAIPTPGHGEHAFNAAALREISDVCVVTSLDDSSSQQSIRRTLCEAKNVRSPLRRTGRMGPIGPYMDVRNEVINKIFEPRTGSRSPLS